MRTSPVRRTLLKTLAVAAAGFGLGAPAPASAESNLTEPGSGQLRDLIARLAAAPRRRDFKTTPMILTSPDQFDAEAIKLVLGAKMEPRQVWNNTDIGGYWLTVMRNALNTQIWGYGHPDFLVVSATHGSAGIALYDQPTWDKYQIAKLLEAKNGDKFKTNILIAEAAGDAKDFENPHGLFAMGSGDSIPLLMKRGVVFMACHNAIWGHAAVLIKRGQNPDQLSHEALAAELTNHLVPGAILTPGIVGTLPESREAAGEFVGHAVAPEERRLVVDVHMQVRLLGAAGVADVADDLAGLDRVAALHRNGAGAHVGVEYVAVRCDLDDRVVAGRIVEVDLDDMLAGMGDVLGHAVRRLDHHAGGDAVDRLVPAEIALDLVFRALPRRPLAVDGPVLHPVDGIALRQPGMAIVDHDGPAMGRVQTVVDGIAGDPFAAQRRRDDDRARVRDGDRRRDDVMRFARVVRHMQRVRDRAGSLRLAEIQRQKDDDAVAAGDGARGRLTGRCRRPELADHRRQLVGAERLLHRARLGIDRIEDVADLAEIGEDHLVVEPRRPVLHDRRRLGDVGHIERRRVGIASVGRGGAEQTEADNVQMVTRHERPPKAKLAAA